mmetsp:Transcript_58291/g.102061  ORF Transcript_58291/g.102061 Transcript_58291/m.102061 type:complete len:291 (+) Transcript_58291:100-972(+)
MFGGKKLTDLTNEDFQKYQSEIAEFGRKEYEAQMREQGYDATDVEEVVREDLQGRTGIELESVPPELRQGATFTTEQLQLKMVDEREKEKPPMTGAQYRHQQALGVKPEMGNCKAPPSYEEFLAANFPHLVEDENKKKSEERQEPEEPLTEEERLRLEALKELDRSQMPACKDSSGQLVKTIEHYMFADGEDHASFYIYFDKDLWPGASKFIQESQVKVESRATSLEIRLQDVPVSDKITETLAEWRLNLSPLFSKVEPTLTTHKVRNGKLSIKLCKAKSGPWKKGVKYS